MNCPHCGKAASVRLDLERMRNRIHHHRADHKPGLDAALHGRTHRDGPQLHFRPRKWEEGNLYPQPGSDRRRLRYDGFAVDVADLKFEAAVLLPSLLAIVAYHLRCHILLEAKRGTAAGPTVRAAHAASPASPVSVVWTGAASAVAGDGFSDDLLLDLRIGLSRFGAWPHAMPRQGSGLYRDNRPLP